MDKQIRILTAIAAAMKTEAKRDGKKEYTRAGLTLWLRYDNGTWTLAISRQNPIVDAERHRVAKAFEVPNLGQYKTTQRDGWQRVWYRWSEPVELSQARLVEAPSVAGSYYGEGA